MSSALPGVADLLRKGGLLYSERPAGLLRNGGRFTPRNANELAKSEKTEVLNCINALNKNSKLLHFYLNDDLALCFEGWYPNYYEKAAFGAFMALLNRDSRMLLDDELGIMKYLQ